MVVEALIVVVAVEALIVVVVVVEALVVVVMVDGLTTKDVEAVAEVLIWLGHDGAVARAIAGTVARAIAGAEAGAIVVAVAGTGHAQGVVVLGTAVTVVVISGAVAIAVVLARFMKDGTGHRVYLGLILNHHLSLS